MWLRTLLVLVLVVSVAGCDSPEKKKKKIKKPDPNTMPSQANDTSFQAFTGRLSKAVEMHDMQTLAGMMTQNFGYRLDPPGEGEGVFQYWDQNNVWPQLQAVLAQGFAPKGNFMVAPPAFTTDAEYNGWRAGLTLVNGSWKFAYFVRE